MCVECQLVPLPMGEARSEALPALWWSCTDTEESPRGDAKGPEC